MAKQYDAELYVNIGSNLNMGARVFGFIYNDTKGRFPDGTPVTTSSVALGCKDDEGEYIQTRNTMYKITKLSQEDWIKLMEHAG